MQCFKTRTPCSVLTTHQCPVVSFLLSPRRFLGIKEPESRIGGFLRFLKSSRIKEGGAFLMDGEYFERVNRGELVLLICNKGATL